MGDRTAFFYGTLMEPQILRRVLLSSITHLTILPAILPNHSRHHVRYADYPGVIPHEGSSVRGTYVTGLKNQDILRLDVFEGSQYERRKVFVKLIADEGKKDSGKKEKDGVVEAETYIFLDKDDLEEKEWDYEEFKREKLSRWVGSNEEYEDLNDGDIEIEDEEAMLSAFAEDEAERSAKKAIAEKEVLESAV